MLTATPHTTSHHAAPALNGHLAARKKGFTLVEVSIVLVIIGLLVGGVLAGQSLIRAAELRTVTTQSQQYITAIQSFRDKYFALPGDMSNAQSVWGVAHATPATCVTTASTGPLTCNGDGNNQINEVSTGSNEIFRFWQHLANAGLITGQYDGITHGATADSVTSANAPQSSLSNGLWWTDYRGTLSGVSDWFDGDYGNVLVMGGTTVNSVAYTPILTPGELWNIDTKLDDGKPATGNVVLMGFGTLSTCTSTASSAVLTATYLLTSSSKACSIAFRNHF